MCIRDRISTTVNATRIEHHFNYFTVKEFNNSLIRQPMFRDMDTEIESSLLRWHTNYTPVLTNTHYSLELLPQKMPSLYDDKSVTVRNKLIGEPVYDKFVVGHLTSDTSDLMPRTTFKVAKLIVGETTAVSYTHLDVYKRQVYICSIFWSCLAKGV